MPLPGRDRAQTQVYWGSVLPPRGEEKGDLFLNMLTYTLYVWNGAAWNILTGGSGSATFVGLTDTPATLVGQGGKVAIVNAGGTAIEFTDPIQFAIDNFAVSAAFPASPVLNQYIVVVDQGVGIDGLWVFDGASWVQRAQF